MLRSSGRGQGAPASRVQAWFQTATEELQTQLLSDWGAAQLVRDELASARLQHAEVGAHSSGHQGSCRNAGARW